MFLFHPGTTAHVKSVLQPEIHLTLWSLCSLSCSGS